MENMEIDLDEYDKQKYDIIIKNGSYCQLTILVDDITKEAFENEKLYNDPIVHLNINNANILTISTLYSLINEVKNRIEEEHPMVKLLNLVTRPTEDYSTWIDREKDDAENKEG